jgi:hypothetical protein
MRWTFFNALDIGYLCPRSTNSIASRRRCLPLVNRFSKRVELAQK